MTAMISVTLQEAIRKKTFIVMTILSVLYLILWTILLYYYNDSGVRAQDYAEINTMADLMITQMGFQFSSMLLSLLTIMLAAGSISNEVESGMVHAILSRPIRRSSYVLGRFLGLAILAAVYSTVFFAVLLIVGRIFSLQSVLALHPGQIFHSWLLYTLVPICLLCLTMCGSTWIKTVPNGLLMIFVYILGNIGGTVEMIGNYMDNAGVIGSGIFISLISPFHTLYTEAQRVLLPPSSIAGDLMQSMGGMFGSGRAASSPMFVYIALYAAGLLWLATYRFRKRDI